MAIREMFELKGRAAVVTGGARGIGRACAEALAEMGADLALVDIHEENMAKAAEELAAHGTRVLSHLCDVREAEAVQAMVQDVQQALGHIDILVNSAGIALWAKGEEMTEEEWDRVIDINLKGTFLCCQAVGRVMIEQKRGSIVNIASMSGSIINKPQPQVAYNASKAGVIHLTKSLAVEWAPHGIRVNCISPGYTATEMTMTVPDYHEGWTGMTPMARMAEPEELLGALIYLASDASSFTTG
ncbi:MAG: SDR family oxidoreductase, partial [Armatimonadota bacterium]